MHEPVLGVLHAGPAGPRIGHDRREAGPAEPADAAPRIPPRPGEAAIPVRGIQRDDRIDGRRAGEDRVQERAGGLGVEPPAASDPGEPADGRIRRHDVDGIESRIPVAPGCDRRRHAGEHLAARGELGVRHRPAVPSPADPHVELRHDEAQEAPPRRTTRAGVGHRATGAASHVAQIGRVMNGPTSDSVGAPPRYGQVLPAATRAYDQSPCPPARNVLPRGLSPSSSPTSRARRASSTSLARLGRCP